MEQRNWYYVYTFAYPDETIFYVGKGINERIKSHLYEAGGRRTSISKVASVIRSLWQRGEKVIIRKPYKDLTEYEAFQMERSLIALLGYEHLVNQSWHECHKMKSIS